MQAALVPALALPRTELKGNNQLCMTTELLLIEWIDFPFFLFQKLPQSRQVRVIYLDL